MSFEPVDAEGATITGMSVLLVVALLVGFVVVLDIVTLLIPPESLRPHRRRRHWPIRGFY